MTDAELHALIEGTPATKPPDLNALIAATPPAETGMGAGEAALTGAVDAIPLGNRAAALGTAMALKLTRALHPNEPWVQNLDTTYEGQLKRQRDEVAKANKDQKWATRVGELVGGGLSMAAIPGVQAAQGSGLLTRLGAAAANAGAYGAAHGAGNAESIPGALRDAATEGAVGAAAGAVGHGLLGEALPAAASKAEDLAGWLKVNSLHPVPTLAEKMAELPGGVPGVGKELLSRGIGSLTKKGTAKEIAAATDEAGKAITKIATAAEAAGAPPIDLGETLLHARVQAAALQAEPTTRAAGDKLAALIEEYQGKYSEPVPVTKALELKRVLSREAYGASKEFAKTSTKAVGDYAKGVGQLERAVDGSLDETLGPEFEAANVSYRRLLAASQAAKRSAGRASGNHIVGLLPLAAGAGAAAHSGGTPGIATGAAAWLLGKYGSQAGARGLFGLSGALGGDAGAAMSPVVAGAGTRALDPYTEALLNSLRQPGAPALPQLAKGEGDQ